MVVFPLPLAGIRKFSLARHSLSPASSGKATILVKWSQCHRLHILFYCRKNIPCCLGCLLYIRNSRKYVVGKGIYYQREIVIFIQKTVFKKHPILFSNSLLSYYLLLTTSLNCSLFSSSLLKGQHQLHRQWREKACPDPLRFKQLFICQCSCYECEYCSWIRFVRALIFGGILLHCDKLTHAHFPQLRYI